MGKEHWTATGCLVSSPCPAKSTNVPLGKRPFPGIGSSVYVMGAWERWSGGPEGHPHCLPPWSLYPGIALPELASPETPMPTSRVMLRPQLPDSGGGPRVGRCCLGVPLTPGTATKAKGPVSPQPEGTGSWRPLTLKVTQTLKPPSGASYGSPSPQPRQGCPSQAAFPAALAGPREPGGASERSGFVCLLCACPAAGRHWSSAPASGPQGAERRVGEEMTEVGDSHGGFHKCLMG